ncbi:MAG: superoxide dismutase, partial [Pseudomonadota bacterium]
MAFELPDLPYAHDALEGYGMSKETLEYHHDIHHKAYVDNGNKLIAGTEWDGKSMEDIVTGTYDSSAVAQNGIFNNISQLWNHNQFWEMMAPGGTAMPGELEASIKDSFGTVDEMKSQFAAAGAGQFGSGWAWLVKDSDGGLKVTKAERVHTVFGFG